MRNLFFLVLLLCGKFVFSQEEIDSIQYRSDLIIHSVRDITSKSLPGTYEVSELRANSPLFAIKTNLLYDLALTPNIGLEIPIGNRWSINATFMRGWWLKKDNTFCWQLEAGWLEGRYWFGGTRNSRLLTGWFAGAFAGAGFYDFQFKRDEGHQGEFFMAGLSGGYSRQIAQTWNIEFAVGAGYLSTDYRRYHVVNDLLFKQATYRYKGVLPLKAEVALVKTLSFSTKKGGSQ